jgi:hypothetical protein
VMFASAIFLCVTLCYTCATLLEAKSFYHF